MDEDRDLQIIKYVETKYNVSVTIDGQWYISKEDSSGGGWDLVPDEWLRDASKNAWMFCFLSKITITKHLKSRIFQQNVNNLYHQRSWRFPNV